MLGSEHGPLCEQRIRHAETCHCENKSRHPIPVVVYEYGQTTKIGEAIIIEAPGKLEYSISIDAKLYRDIFGDDVTKEISIKTDSTNKEEG